MDRREPEKREVKKTEMCKAKDELQKTFDLILLILCWMGQLKTTHRRCDLGLWMEKKLHSRYLKDGDQQRGWI